MDFIHILYIYFISLSGHRAYTSYQYAVLRAFMRSSIESICIAMFHIISVGYVSNSELPGCSAFNDMPLSTRCPNKTLGHSVVTTGCRVMFWGTTRVGLFVRPSAGPSPK